MTKFGVVYKSAEQMASPAMAAVSARRMRVPKVTCCQLWLVKSCISSAVQPPSGPTARAMLSRVEAFRAAVMVLSCSVSARSSFVDAVTSASAAFSA